MSCLNPDPASAPQAVDSTHRRLVDRLRTMMRIRAFEGQVARHFREGNIHGFVHTSLGQEAVAAGICGALRRTDYITTTHRGHGHCLAKGADPGAMMAELFGRETGTGRGRGGSMHIAATELGILGANGVVGAGIPIAVGAGFAARATGRDDVAVAFFGEGAVHCGAFHEGAVLAMAWSAPVVLVCENNRYAEFTHSDGAWGGPSPVERASSYGMVAWSVDGNDVEAVEEVAADAVTAARTGRGPSFVEAQTYRMGGHFEGDAAEYRSEAEREAWRAKDPIERLAGVLRADEDGDLIAALGRDAAEEMRDVVGRALAAPYPAPETVLEYVDD